jgi:hypothetical protein
METIFRASLEYKVTLGDIVFADGQVDEMKDRATSLVMQAFDLVLSNHHDKLSTDTSSSRRSHNTSVALTTSSTKPSSTYSVPNTPLQWSKPPSSAVPIPMSRRQATTTPAAAATSPPNDSAKATAHDATCANTTRDMDTNLWAFRNCSPGMDSHRG